MKDALVQMRAELGEDAIILASEATANGVVVSAAPAQDASAEHPAPGRISGDIASFEDRYRNKLLSRLRGKGKEKAVAFASFSRPELLAQLRAHRVPDSLAHALAEAAEQSGYSDAALALASALGKRMSPAPLTFEEKRAFLVIGPNGAGKTAVAAKLAAEARLAGREVCLAATDAQSAGQRERLETFAVHLGIAVVDASSLPLFTEAAALARRRDMLLIADTAGIDARNPAPEILAYTQAGIAETIGVISALTDAEEADEIAAGLAKLGASRLAVTSLDLSRRKGAVAVLATTSLALAYATSSPYLVEGLESLTPPSLARALLAPP